LLVAIIMGTTGFGANGRTFTDSAGLTWTTDESLFITGYAKAMTIATAPVGSSPSSMTVTCTSAEAQWFSTALVVLEVEDYDSVAGVVQAQISGDDNTTGALSVSLTSTSTAGNELIAAVVTSDDTQSLDRIDTGTGYTQLYEYIDSDGAAHGHIQTISSAQSSVDWLQAESPSFGGWLVGAIEIGVDSGGGGGPVIAPLAFMHLFGTLR
jgi:hypothetical protein